MRNCKSFYSTDTLTFVAKRKFSSSNEQEEWVKPILKDVKGKQISDQYLRIPLNLTKLTVPTYTIFLTISKKVQSNKFLLFAVT